jgi:Tfp pilus assembly protein PilV
MAKKTKFTGFKFLEFKGLKNIKSLSLSELMISILMVGMMILSFYTLQTFSNVQAITADRRAKVQNDLAYCLEHMSKYVQKATGNSIRQAIQYCANGFRVYVDFNSPPTPLDFSDDGYIDYTLSSNTLTATCSAGAGTCPFTVPENLTSKIIAGVTTGSSMPAIPTNGFYINIGSDIYTLATFLDIGLVGRYSPTEAISTGRNLTTPQEVNPQVALKTKLICNNSSTN